MKKMTKMYIKDQWKQHYISFSIVLILIFLAAALSSLMSVVIGKIVDFVGSNNGDGQNLLLLSCLLIVVVLCKEGANYSREYLAAKIMVQIANELRYKIFVTTLNFKYEYFCKISRASMINRCVSNTEEIQKLALATIPQFFYESIMCIIAFAVITHIYWPLSFVGLMIYSIYLIPVKYFGNKQKNVADSLNKQNIKMKDLFIEKIDEIKTIKIMGSEEKQKRDVEKESKIWSDLFFNSYFTINLFKNFPRVLDALAPGLTFFIGGIKVISGDLTIGDLVTITGLLPAINAPIRSFSNIYLNLKNLENKIEEILQIIYGADIEKCKDNEETISLDNITEIKLENVSLKNDRQVQLKGIYLEIKAGRHIAIIGEKGAGKSTILNVISGIIEATSGKVLIGHRDIKDIDINSLKVRIGVVVQCPYIFEGTVRENLFYKTKIPEWKLEYYLRRVKLLNNDESNLKDFLDREATKLSGGQKQRICLVREVIGKPDILLLDEVTSALDHTTEIEVLKFIEEIMKDKICILITHNIKCASYMPQIVVVEKGKIVEEGNHEMLLRKGGKYEEFWTKQN